MVVFIVHVFFHYAGEVLLIIRNYIFLSTSFSIRQTFCLRDSTKYFLFVDIANLNFIFNLSDDSFMLKIILAKNIFLLKTPTWYTINLNLFDKEWTGHCSNIAKCKTQNSSEIVNLKNY